VARSAYPHPATRSRPAAGGQSTLRALAPKRSFWRAAQLDTLRFALVKVVGRVTELASRITLALPSDYPYRDSLTLLAARAARPP
jgi:Transposase DDE domain group 1